MRNFYLLALAALLSAASCQRPAVDPIRPAATQADVSNTLSETFESGAKGSYAVGNVTLSSGIWSLNEALIGNSTSDAKMGTQSVRVRNAGKVTMGFDKAGGAGAVQVSHANYGSDAGGAFQCWYSTNGGASYTQAGGTVACGSALATATFTVNAAGSVRIELRKTDGGTGRINLDNVTISDYAVAVAPTLTSISPNTAQAGAGAFTLTASGANYTTGSVVNWNGSALATTYVSASQLTASVPASLVAAAGSASVTVTTSGAGTSAALSFTITAAPAGKRYLFDATKAETAGNADWVIDQDGSPQRYPTPAQSTVTSSTSGTYWTGAISSWGIALVKAGHSVQTLPSSGQITYGNSGNAQDLSNYDVFVVDEPNVRFTSAEKTAILQFVQAGGGLFMISDHANADRNNDGWDAREIWNDLFTTNSVQANPFGMSVDNVSMSGVSSNVSTVSSPILSGPAGTVSTVSFNAGATLTLSPTANSSVTGLVWKSGVTRNNSNVYAASATFGSGRAFMIGDSSPMDDGTGNPSDNLYTSWNTYSHTQLMLNASYWLGKVQ